jgi:hypothetical protein
VCKRHSLNGTESTSERRSEGTALLARRPPVTGCGSRYVGAAVTVAVAGEVLQCGLDDDLVAGSEREPVFPDPLTATSPRTSVSQRPSTIAARFSASSASSRSQPSPRGPNASALMRVGRWPNPERLHAEGAAQQLILILRIAEDECAVAEVHHPQQQRLRLRTCRGRLSEK